MKLLFCIQIFVTSLLLKTTKASEICKGLVKGNFCGVNVGFMAFNCPGYCSGNGGLVPKRSVVNDPNRPLPRGGCQALVRANFCLTQPGLMAHRCPTMCAVSSSTPSTTSTTTRSGKPVFPIDGIAKVECQNVAWRRVEVDPRCLTGESLGCNAGGQGQLCRFCGHGNLPKCPSDEIGLETRRRADPGAGAESQTVQCRNIGWRTVMRDPRCQNGESLGCNAGGQHQLCRFCGFATFPDCLNNGSDELDSKDTKG